MKINININDWKEFRVGDLFDIRPTKSYKYTNNKLFDGGDNPVIVNSAYNNGVGGYTSLDNTEQGNIITYSDTVDGNTIFYQEHDFVGYPHVQGLYPKEPYKNLWNKECLLFFVSIFRKSAFVKGFNYGNKFRRDIAANLIIKLPCKTSSPDFKFMENYINNLNIKVKHIIEVLNSTNKIKSSLIDTTIWKEFKIGDIFEIKRPQRRIYSDYEPGNIPFVSSGDYNNGVIGYVKPKNSDIVDLGKCISISPVDGKALYQPTDFLGRGGGGSSIFLLYNKQLDKYNGIFIATIITRLLTKYEFKNMANSSTIINESLLLPSDSFGMPDFDYMTKYMLAMKEKISKKIDILFNITNK
ncbi:MAG: restriction endonuclease subunit S [Mucispirillum sp.]|nr:restriction endonuclease subunit S [Mucispirillum sp.]